MDEAKRSKLKEIFRDRARYLRIPWRMERHDGIAYLKNSTGVVLARFTLGSSDDCESAVEAVNSMPEIIETLHKQEEIIGLLRPEVLRFAVAMEIELLRNDHKPGWKNMSDADLLRRVSQELDELRMVIHNDRPSDEVLSEAADVANFAMMIADNSGMMTIGTTKWV